MTGIIWKWFILVLVLLHSATILGNDTLGGDRISPSNKSAESIYKSGISHFDAGEYQVALKEFREAYSIKASWKLLYNIGQSAAAAREYGIALESFEHYLVDGQEQLSLERIDQVREEITRLKIVVGYIELKTDIAGDIYVDGYHRGKSPLAGVLPVTSGVRTLEIKDAINGSVIFTQEVSVVGEKTVVIAFDNQGNNEMMPVETGTVETKKNDASITNVYISPVNGVATTNTAAPAPPQTVQLESPSFAPGIVLIGIGLAGLGTGTGFVVKNLKEQKLAEESTDPKYKEAYNNKVKPMNNIGAAVGYGIGALTITIGIILISKARKSRANPSVSQTTHLLPSPGSVTVIF
ncbi:MAG: hypothetical protein JXX14_07900 [Deltaproteobacteria bacterium]|nr:hypothetical protein [Deltaproteobacteria bacterium]